MSTYSTTSLKNGKMTDLIPVRYDIFRKRWIFDLIIAHDYATAREAAKKIDISAKWTEATDFDVDKFLITDSGASIARVLLE
eukprot:SAG31_NODE_3125_length_4647_cov_5.148417_7_plen_81_part_01